MKRKVLNRLKKIAQTPSITEIEAEAEIKKGTLSRILSGERNLTENHIKKLLPILEKYGYKF